MSDRVYVWQASEGCVFAAKTGKSPKFCLGGSSPLEARNLAARALRFWRSVKREARSSK